MKNTTHKICLLCFIVLLSLSGCAIQEVAIEEPLPKRKVKSNPYLAENVDSIKNDIIVSAMQKSPAYILQGYTLYKNGRYQIEIPPEDFKVLGLSEQELEEYRKKLIDLD